MRLADDDVFDCGEETPQEGVHCDLGLQGAIAPLSSALGLLPLHTPDPALAATIKQVRRGLASGALTCTGRSYR